jgi:hypothetical protein
VIAAPCPEERAVRSLLHRLLPPSAGRWAPGDVPSGLNGERFRDLLVFHEVHSYLYPLAKTAAADFPPGVMAFAQANYYAALARVQRLTAEFARIRAALTQAGIPVVPIKGLAVLEPYYTHLPVRPTTDIDLLVKPADLPAAGEVLKQLGYAEAEDGANRAYWLEKQCHLQFSLRRSERDWVYLDLHFGLDFQRGGRTILPDLWARVRGGQLSPEDALFSLALHQRRFGKVLCLKNVIDAALIIQAHGAALDWDYVRHQAGQGRMRSVMYYLLAQVEDVFGAAAALPDLSGILPAPLKRGLIRWFIRRNQFAGGLEARTKELYLKAHFLLYDDFLEPAAYIWNIPLEQFAKFYGLDARSKQTKTLHRARFAYIFYRAVRQNCRAGGQ